MQAWKEARYNSMTTQKPQKQTEHSRNFEKYKGYYDHGFWNAKMLKNAVVKKAITADEFEEITGEAYTK